MVCAFIMALYGHSYLNGYYKACYYDCGETRNRRFIVSPDYVCPMEFKLELKTN